MGTGQNATPKKHSNLTRSRKGAYAPAPEQSQVNTIGTTSRKKNSNPAQPGTDEPMVSEILDPQLQDEQQSYTIDEEQALSPFSSLLRHILRNDRVEISRVARELEVTENTLYRWMNGSSEPRITLLKRLPDALPEQRNDLIHAIHQTFPDTAEIFTFGLYEVRKDIYRRVLDLLAATPEDDARHWQIVQAIFESALLHLDADRNGLAITYARLMPTHTDGIHSLRESIMRGNLPWPSSLESRVYLGSTTLAGTAAMLQRTQIWSESSQDDRLLVDVDEFERSAGACPVMRAGRLSGVLIISSTRPDFYTDPIANQSLTEYAQLLSLAMRESDFYPPASLNLRPMPALQWQRTEINRTLVNRVITYAHKHNIARMEAERWVLQEMELEFEDLGSTLLEQRIPNA